MPEELTTKAAGIIDRTAEHAQATIRASYPEVTGNLKAGLTIERKAERGIVRVWLRNRAPHAYLYEHGTQGRPRELRGTGMYPAGTNRGPMPAGNKFIPAAIRARAVMYQELIDLVEEAGFEVTR